MMFARMNELIRVYGCDGVRHDILRDIQVEQAKIEKVLRDFVDLCDNAVSAWEVFKLNHSIVKDMAKAVELGKELLGTENEVEQ